MGTLSAERCGACRRDSPRVTDAEIAELTREVPDWRRVERDGVARLERVFHFPSFADALAFTNRVGALAEGAGRRERTRRARRDPRRSRTVNPRAIEHRDRWIAKTRTRQRRLAPRQVPVPAT